MEKEGLQWVLRHLQENGLTTKVLVTDRHQQINKWIRENYPCIKHYYDIWHVAKGMLNFLTFCSMHDCVITGFRKKLEAVAKQSGCELIGKWQRSIINHLYWCVSSTSGGDTDTMIAKWLSLDNHVHNKHTHETPKFKKCAHGRLGTHKKKWFKRRKYICFVQWCLDTFVHLAMLSKIGIYCSSSTYFFVSQIPKQVRSLPLS